MLTSHRAGKRDHYWVNFITYRNIQTLFDKNRETGECARGLYFWGTNMIIVHDLKRETIEQSIAGLIDEGELESCCARVE
jgi:hypothetical protein